MVAKLFITGGTGYIGGTVLDTIIRQHPDYDITALLRTQPQAFTTSYPNVKTLRGDYDSTALLTSAAAEADIIVHNGNSDHEPSLCALVAGLLESSCAAKPKYLIHSSGTAIISDWNEAKYQGKPTPKLWSDVSDIDAIASRPDGSWHRHTKKFLQGTAREYGDRLKIAIVCPPDIYGPGRGIGKRVDILDY